jgi:hypothetical protein
MKEVDHTFYKKEVYCENMLIQIVGFATCQCRIGLMTLSIFSTVGLLPADLQRLDIKSFIDGA